MVTGGVSQLSRADVSCFDQQIPMEKAFRGPTVLPERLGHLDAAQIADADPEGFAAVTAQPPAVHRFPGSTAQRVQQLCGAMVERHGGRGEALWDDVDDGAQVLRRLEALPGFDTQKARTFLSLLGEQCGITPQGCRQAAGEHGEDGVSRSVADVASQETLLGVRAHEQAVAAAQASVR